MENKGKSVSADSSYSQERVVTNTAASVGQLEVDLAKNPIKPEADALNAECDAKEEESKAKEGECETEVETEAEAEAENVAEAETEATAETPTVLSFADHSISLESELMKLNLQRVQSNFSLSNMKSTNFIARLEQKCHRRNVNGYYVTSDLDPQQFFGVFEGRSIDIARVTDWIAICCVAPSQHSRSVLRLSDATAVVLPTYVKFQRRYTEPTLEQQRSMLVEMLEKH